MAPVSEPLRTRRDFLAVAAGAALAAKPLAEKLQHVAAPLKRSGGHPALGPLAQVEHVVIVMQENCSFDHYFGTLRGVRGFSDRAALRLADGRSVFHQPYATAPGGALLPWRLDVSRANPCATTVNNAWTPAHETLHGGRMDGFVSAGGVDSMRYFTRADIPWHMALADAFTVCDGYFASLLGPTNPNRLYSMSGTVDAAGGRGGPVIDNRETPPYTWTTYPERLEANRVSWRIYQQTDNFDDNALAWFRSYQRARPGSPLYENGIRPRASDAFARDVATGRLPKVSWVIAPTSQSEHPGHSPGPGAEFCNEIMQALFHYPKTWARTVVIVTYDEPGGYFDHIRPPAPPAGSRDEFIGGLPVGLGFRVPTVICSPWSRGGFVCSHTFDHTSTLRLLERRFGVTEPNISAWRRRTCGDLTATLDLSHADHTIPALPKTRPLVARSDAACAVNPAGQPPLQHQRLPVQEPGRRPRR
jgi:phospholipase C